MIRYNRNLKEKARHLRTQMTDSERALWGRLRRKQVLSVQFYRQKPIGNYMVDFYAPRAKIVVEVDGSQHMESERHRTYRGMPSSRPRVCGCSASTIAKC